MQLAKKAAEIPCRPGQLLVLASGSQLVKQLPGGLILGGKHYQFFGIAKRGLPIPVVPMNGIGE